VSSGWASWGCANEASCESRDGFPSSEVRGVGLGLIAFSHLGMPLLIVVLAAPGTGYGGFGEGIRNLALYAQGGALGVGRGHSGSGGNRHSARRGGGEFVWRAAALGVGLAHKSSRRRRLRLGTKPLLSGTKRGASGEGGVEDGRAEEEGDEGGGRRGAGTGGSAGCSCGTLL
jgi:hypothetical protein